MNRRTSWSGLLLSIGVLAAMACSPRHAADAREPVPALSAAGRLARGSDAERVDAYLRSLVPWGFSGNVLVARRDTVLLVNGYGLANREQNIPFTTTTQIPIGSLVKDFTSTALRVLASEGRLRLTDSIGGFFPDLPTDKASITVDQLIRHASGLPIGLRDPGSERSRTAFFRALARAPLHFAPGTGNSYSNVGYSVLAAIIEDLTGRDLESFVRERFLLPNEIRETGWHFPAFDSARVARTYGMDGNVVPTGLAYTRAEGPRPAWGAHGAGAWMSTLGDLHRWTRMRSTLPSATREPPVKGRSFARLGGNEAFETAVRIYDADSVVVILHNNVNGSLSEVLSERVGAMFVSGAPATPLPAPRDARGVVDAIAGRYELPHGAEIRVAARGDAVTLSPSGQDAFNLLFAVPERRRAQMTAYAARTDSLVRATLAGDWTAFSGMGSAASLTQERAAAVNAFGPLRGHRVIGVLPTGMGGHAIVEMEYERGARYERVAWAGPRVGLYRVETEPPAVVVRWIGGDAFAHFDLASASLRSFRIGARQLTVDAPGASITATRR